jgi:hypothetical protein
MSLNLPVSSSISSDISSLIGNTRLSAPAVPAWSPPVTPLIWLDATDRSTLFQDIAGTNPVTATAQRVGRILDKSGAGNHFYASADANRALYTEASGLKYLDFDAIGRRYITAFRFSAHNAVTVVMGIRRRNNTNNQQFFSVGSASLNGFDLGYVFASNVFQGTSGGSSNTRFLTVSAGGTFPSSHVITLQSSTAQPYARFHNGNTLGTASTAVQGSANYSASHVPTLGAYSSGNNGMQGDVYCLLAFPGLISDPNLAIVKTYVASISNVTL